MNAACQSRIDALHRLLDDGRERSSLETACVHRQIDDLERGHERGLVWHEDQAQRAVGFCKLLKHWKGEHHGKAFNPEPWQEHCILAPLFGWYRADGLRRFRTGYIEVPRKNGKTSLAAVLGLQGLIADGEHGAEVYSAATMRDQASILFSDAQNMVRLSPGLLKRVTNWKHSITCESLNGSFKPLSADHNSLHGLNVSRCMVDEIHSHKTRDLWDVLVTATGARKQPLVAAITTAGFDRSSICWELHEYTRKVYDGTTQDDSWFGFIACADAEDDPLDPATWHKANPNLDVSIRSDYLEQEARKAKESPSYENTFRRLHLNQWCMHGSTRVAMADGSLKLASEVAVGDWVEAWDENTKTLVKAKVQNVAVMPASPLYRIFTRRGRSITVNAEHPFWCRWGRSTCPQYGWKRADELSSGNRVLSALGHCPTDRGGKRLHPEDARFLGIMTGDGTCNGTPRLTTLDPELVEFFSKWAESKGEKVVPLPDGVHFDIRHAKASRKQTFAKKFLKNHGLWGKICHTKRVPQQIFKSPSSWAAFLSGYLDTDGHVQGGRMPSVIWVSANRDLLDDCQHLLSFMGVQSVIRKDTSKWRLEVMDAESIDILAEKMTLLVERKRTALNNLRGRVRRTGEIAGDRRTFDMVSSVENLPDDETIAITVDGYHTHVTNGLVTHNTEQSVRWLPMHAWDACEADFDGDCLRGEECFAGLDLASTRDVNSLVLYFKNSRRVLPFFWVPEDAHDDRGERDRRQVINWANQGLIRKTSGNVTDYTEIVSDILRLAQKYRILNLGYDPWGPASAVVQQLQAEGFDKLTEFRQGFASFNAPMKELERLVVSGQLKHNGDPVLRWMAGNVTIKEDPAGSIKPDKSKSADKIDGIVSLVMAIGLSLVDDNAANWYVPGQLAL